MKILAEADEKGRRVLSVTPEQVLEQVRFAVRYAKARYPKTRPEAAEAADKLVSSKAFADFVADVLEVVAPEALTPKERLTELLDEEIHDGLG